MDVADENDMENDDGVITLTKISVAFICDNHYVIPTAVAITSLICNKHPQTHLDIYIIANELSKAEIEKLSEFGDPEIDVHIIRVSFNPYENTQQCAHVTSAAYLKFDLAELIPHVDKVLFLDSDILIQKDLSPLFVINIDDDYAGVVQDIPLIDNDLHIMNYFNSGVMLLNLTLMRRDNVSKALYRIRESRDDLIYMDQDCLNILFHGKVKLLPIIYNLEYHIFFYEKKKYSLDVINKSFGTNYSSLDDIRKNAYIIHFAAHYKPWIYFDAILTSEWDAYLKMSPFKCYKFKRKSIKTIKFIFSYKILTALFYFFQYWHDHGFRFALRKVKNYFAGRK